MKNLKTYDDKHTHDDHDEPRANTPGPEDEQHQDGNEEFKRMILNRVVLLGTGFPLQVPYVPERMTLPASWLECWGVGGEGRTFGDIWNL